MRARRRMGCEGVSNLQINVNQLQGGRKPGWKGCYGLSRRGRGEWDWEDTFDLAEVYI